MRERMPGNLVEILAFKPLPNLETARIRMPWHVLEKIRAVLIYLSCIIVPIISLRDASKNKIDGDGE